MKYNEHYIPNPIPKNYTRECPKNDDDPKKFSGFYKNYYECIDDQYSSLIDEFIPSYNDGQRMSMGK